MPSFEQSKSESKANAGDAHSYNKILAVMNQADVSDKSVFARANKFSVSLLDSNSFYNTVSSMSDERYRYMASADLSSILFPYDTWRMHRSSIPSGLPTFYGDNASFDQGIIPPTQSDNAYRMNIYKLNPIEWSRFLSTNSTKDRWSSPSGDSINDLASWVSHRGDINQYRDMNIIRGIGIRLPMMGVGWGYTTDGLPCPSGIPPVGQVEGTHYPKGTKFFKGGVTEGYNVDPQDYIAAPIELRFDRKRNTWGAPKGFWARIKDEGTWVKHTWSNPATTSGIAYSWEELFEYPSGELRTDILSRGGSVNNQPLFVIPNSKVSIGTVVWVEPNDGIPQHFAKVGGLPSAAGRFKVLQIIDTLNPGTWGVDYLRMATSTNDSELI